MDFAGMGVSKLPNGQRAKWLNAADECANGYVGSMSSLAIWPFAIWLFEPNPQPSHTLGVDDEDGLAVGDFDEVVGLVGDEHRLLDLEIRHARDGRGQIGEADGKITLAIELAEGLAELGGVHGEGIKASGIKASGTWCLDASCFDAMFISR
jgi:hypothetical protein